VEFGQPIDIHPSEALLSVLHLSAGHLAWLRSELGTTDDKTTVEAQVLLRMWDDERDRIARISKAALDAGVQERQIQLVERYGEMLAALLQGIFGDRELGLTQKQQGKLPVILKRHLIALEEQPALPAASAR
jgi:hypothetical protein